jgi:hypothetical protein
MHGDFLQVGRAHIGGGAFDGVGLALNLTQPPCGHGLVQPPQSIFTVFQEDPEQLLFEVRITIRSFPDPAEIYGWLSVCCWDIHEFSLSIRPVLEVWSRATRPKLPPSARPLPAGMSVVDFYAVINREIAGAVE